jgi:hypothetical protein
MTLKKVKSGDPLAIPASTFNTFVDAANDYLARQREQSQKATPAGRCAGIVLVRNDSGAARERFEVLGVSAPVFTPGVDLDAFKNTRALVGVTPTDPGHLGKFVILLEPVPAGELAQALASGVCPVRLDVKDEQDGFADVNDGTCVTLKTGPKGAAVILWKESGTGQKWGVVHLAGSGPMVLWGKATADWSAGNTVELDPCREDGTDNGQDNITGHVVCPREGDRGDPNYEAGLVPDIRYGDILAYLPYGDGHGIVVNAKWVVAAEYQPRSDKPTDPAHPWLKVLKQSGDDWYEVKHKGPGPIFYYAGTEDCTTIWPTWNYLAFDRRGHLVKAQHYTCYNCPDSLVTILVSDSDED